MRNILLIAIVLAFSSGCGQKGPLYHPSDKPAPKKPATPAPQPSAESKTPGTSQ